MAKSARETVGARLRRLRQARGLTQSELAKPRYTAAFVSSVETGTRTPSGDALRYFADRLGAGADELLGGSSPREFVQLDLELVEIAEEFLAGNTPSAAPAMLKLARRAERLDRQRQAGIAWLWLAGYAEGDARTKYVAAAENALAGDAPPYRAMVVPLRTSVLIAWGETQYALHLLETCHDELLREGYPQPSILLTLRACLAEGHLRQGDLARAGGYADEALRLSRGDGELLAELTRGHVQVCRTYLAAERFADAAASISAAQDLMQERALHPAIAQCLLARARLRGHADDREGALADLVAARDATAPGDTRALTIELAGAFRALGKLVEAEELLAEVGPEIPGDDPLSAAVRFELGCLALARGERETAVGQLTAAAELATGLGARSVLARSLEQVSVLLGASGRQEEAADLLRAGLRTLGAETG
ncbi:helix-turn-helix domain-containing protein [Amycolatopsis sp. H20-H5]|uniref:helix-turn-helix domain-containing protein n=1 Tax=Amycolatopsis sp. H20-H5 TaxID=3046309 RepID=UPI002DBA5151|nr:helix-turn-helix transcriptional regulator [Amycolatopsis sp. H20-H5]MEC3979738.1 helix-turn-helix transcriptional regulator [Amycolatopsis sp. H20-H5]